jgi:hypothetical protein
MTGRKDPPGAKPRDQNERFIAEHGEGIELLCARTGLSFAEVWYLGNATVSKLPAEISPIFSFDVEGEWSGDPFGAIQSLIDNWDQWLEQNPVESDDDDHPPPPDDLPD